MKKRLTLSIISALLMMAPCAFADIYVIVNAANPVKALTREQVNHLFLAKFNAFPDGRQASPHDLPAGAVRDAFYATTAGKTDMQLRAYWARLTFTGSGRPPREEAGEDAMIKAIRQDPAGIGYVSRIADASGVKPVLTLP